MDARRIKYDATHHYETVNHPAHYNDYDIEVIDMMRRIWGDDDVRIFCKLNAFKYRLRAGHKDNIEQDLAKERWYLDYIAQMETEGASNL